MGLLVNHCTMLLHTLLFCSESNPTGKYCGNRQRKRQQVLTCHWGVVVSSHNDRDCGGGCAGSLACHQWLPPPSMLCWPSCQACLCGTTLPFLCRARGVQSGHGAARPTFSLRNVGREMRGALQKASPTLSLAFLAALKHPGLPFIVTRLIWGDL